MALLEILVPYQHRGLVVLLAQVQVEVVEALGQTVLLLYQTPQVLEVLVYLHQLLELQ
jgi:hypothetical protein